MQQRAIQTRQAILAAARDEFASKGFAGARVDVLAAAANVNKQSIYAYFTDKAGLFAEILNEAFVKLAQEEAQFLELSARDIPQLAERILACYVGIHSRHPEIWRLLAWENLEGGQHAAGLAHHQKPVFDHLRRLYRQGQRSGHFQKRVPFEGFIFNLIAVSYFMFSNRQTLKRSIGIDCSRADARQALCQAVIRQLDAGRKAPP